MDERNVDAAQVDGPRARLVKCEGRPFLDSGSIISKSIVVQMGNKEPAQQSYICCLIAKVLYCFCDVIGSVVIVVIKMDHDLAAGVSEQLITFGADAEALCAMEI